MQAIVTKYHGPGNRIGSRVSATAAAGRKYTAWDGRLGLDGNHAAAALALCAWLGWTGELVPGNLPDGSHVFVFTGRDTKKPAYVSDPYGR